MHDLLAVVQLGAQLVCVAFQHIGAIEQIDGLLPDEVRGLDLRQRRGVFAQRVLNQAQLVIHLSSV